MAIKTRMGFKVVRVENGRLFSVVVHVPESEVEYIMDEWVVSREHQGPLAVFSDLDSAALFCILCRSHNRDVQGEVRVYSCEYIPSRKKNLFSRLLSMDGKYRTIIRREEFPEGTVLADKVKLLNMVEGIE